MKTLKHRRLWLFLLSAATAGLWAVPASAEPSTSVRGRLTVIHADDFDQKRTREFFILDETDETGKTTGRSFDLRFDHVPKKRLLTGSLVRVKGQAAGSVVIVEADEDAGLEVLEAGAAVEIGDRSVLLILLNFSDKSLDCAGDNINSLMFGSSSSVDQLYQAISLGQLGFSGEIAGPYTLSARSTGSCNISDWASEAESLAAADGFSPNSYMHKVYVMPTNSCGWAGYGTYGGSPSQAWIFYCGMPDIFAHELGHNLGMRHASTLRDEYGDRSDIMGYSGVGLRGINAPHRLELGWLPAGAVVSVTQTGNYTLSPLSAGTTGGPHPQVLRLSEGGQDFYVSYRVRAGFDSQLVSGYSSRTNIHTWSGTANNTYFIASVGDGETFTEGTLSITQVSHNADSVTVSIGTDDPIDDCVTAAPAASFRDSSKAASAGDAVAFEVVVRNNDSGPCGALDCDLRAVVPSDWTSSLSVSSLRLDAGQSGSATLLITVPASASDGSHRVEVHVTSANGDATAAGTVLIDANPPSTPTGLQANVKRRQVQLSWNASTDNNGVAGYFVLRSGINIGRVSDPHFTDGTVQPGVTYVYQVEAYDDAGNISAPSEELAITVANKKGGRRGGRKK